MGGNDPVNLTSRPLALPQHDRRRFGLDAARAAAILMVFVTHGQVYLLPLAGRYAGYVPSIGGAVGEYGIELFFALSGFLIGGMLLDVQQRGPTTRAVGIFLVRRWMRTLPLYYVVMFVLLLFPVLEPASRQGVPSYFLLVQNFVTPMPPSNWFGVSWSLTIEEWSYVVLPLLAFILCRRTREPIASAALILIAGGIAVRLAIGVSATPWQLSDWDVLIRKMVVSRMDAIAYGVLAAVWFRRCGRLPTWTLAVSFLLLTWSAWTCTRPLDLAGTAGWSAFFPLTSIGFALLMPWCAEVRPPPLIAPAIHFVARSSYSLYLVHWSFMFVAGGVTPGWQLVVYLCGSIITATVLTYAIELPIMRLRPSQLRRAPAPCHLGLVLKR